MQLSFLGREFNITADRQQILDLLISTFEELVVTSKDVQQREREIAAAHAELERQFRLVELERKRLRAVVDAVPVPLFVTAPDGRVSHASKASAHALQADLSAILGGRIQDVVSFVDADDKPVAFEELPHSRATRECMPSTRGESFDLFVTRPDGVRVPVVLEASPILGKSQQPAGCVTTVHTLGGLAEHDPLTGLLNAATFLDRAAGLLIASSGRAGLLVIELDRFNVRHASLSTAKRTATVVEAARRLRQVFDPGPGTVSPSESMLAYLGGYRFGVLLTNLPDSFRLVHLAETSRRVISAATVEGTGITLTASVGIAVDDGDQQGTHLFAAASEAVNNAVSLGGNRVETLGASAAKDAMDRLQLEIELREAIENHNITLDYQPEYDLRSGVLIGFEALARWHHPELGPIAPPVFISLAEQSGLILSLGRQLLKDACAHAQSWPVLNAPLTIAVNVSAIQLRAEFVAEVVAVLSETGLDPSRLILEVTETAAMSDPATTGPVIEELRGIGVRFSLDDFGTGYASLTQLTRIKFEQLKLDRSFVSMIHQPGTDAIIARSIIALGRALEIPVVAEGVETQEQLRVLRELDCDMCQGYLLSKPIPAGLVHEFLESPHERLGDPVTSGA